MKIYQYFDTTDLNIYRKPTADSESFINTLDLDEGWVLYYTLSHYDSNGDSPGISYEVIDVYKTEADAEIEAKKITRYGDKKDGPEKADGSIVHKAWNNWGNSLEGVYIAPIQVKDEKERGRRRIY